MWSSGNRLIYAASLFGIQLPDVHRPLQIRCPFHQHDQPSARFHPETESIHYFSDNKNWTPLTFYAEMKHIPLRQGAEELAVHGLRVQLLKSKSPEPDEQLCTLIDLTSIRFRTRPDTPARRNLFDTFDRVQALVLTGSGDPISAAWRRPGWRTPST